MLDTAIDTATADCNISDAQCVRIHRFCICHCLPGYFLDDEKCLKSKCAFYFITIRRRRS